MQTHFSDDVIIRHFLSPFHKVCQGVSVNNGCNGLIQFLPEPERDTG